MHFSLGNHSLLGCRELSGYVCVCVCLETLLSLVFSDKDEKRAEFPISVMKHKILPGEEVKQPIAPGHLCLALKVCE